jgi:hypothetical protein
MSNIMYTGNGTDDLITITSAGAMPTNSITTSSTISMNVPVKATPEYVLDTFEMNQVVVEHKVQEQELLKLKETSPDFADHIKANLTKATAEKIVQKMAFTKTKDKDMDVHSFRGRVWVFTKEELIDLIRTAQNA